jgi:hypothetical protein
LALVQKLFNKISPATFDGLIKFLADKAAMARAIIENAGTVDRGRVFCATMYNFEGDNPSVFVGHKVCEKLVNLVAEIMYPELEKAAKIAANLVRDFFSLLKATVLETRRRLDDAQAASSTEDEESAVAEQEPASLRSRRSTATKQTNYKQVQRARANLESYSFFSSSEAEHGKAEQGRAGDGDARELEEA